MDIGGIVFDLREGLFFLVALAVIYMLGVVWRLHRLSNRASDTDITPEKKDDRNEPAWQNDPLAEKASIKEGTGAPLWQKKPPSYVYEPPETIRNPALSGRWSDTPEAIAQQALINTLSRELSVLRDEVLSLRKTFSRSQEDFQHEILQLQKQLQAVHLVPSLYGEAIHLANTGLDAFQIAERCGITRAEAELVAALAHHQKEGNDAR